MGGEFDSGFHENVKFPLGLHHPTLGLSIDRCITKDETGVMQESKKKKKEFTPKHTKCKRCEPSLVILTKKVAIFLCEQ